MEQNKNPNVGGKAAFSFAAALLLMLISIPFYNDSSGDIFFIYIGFSYFFIYMGLWVLLLKNYLPILHKIDWFDPVNKDGLPWAFIMQTDAELEKNGLIKKVSQKINLLIGSIFILLGVYLFLLAIKII